MPLPSKPNEAFTNFLAESFPELNINNSNPFGPPTVAQGNNGQNQVPPSPGSGDPTYTVIYSSEGGVVTTNSSDIQGSNEIINDTIDRVTAGFSSVGTGDIAGGAASISSAQAGVASDIASKIRSKFLPAGGEIFTNNQEPTAVNVNSDGDWRVRISAPMGLLKGQSSKLLDRLSDNFGTNGVVFPYLPTITVSSSASYNTQNFTHNNYPFHAYQNSQIDDITITGEFSCESTSDAEYWVAANLFFKAATKMFFGKSSEAGNPPIICKLNGYGAHIFNDVPVVIKNYSVTLPQDVDYVLYEDAGTKTWVPILSEMSVTVAPIYSREKIRQFSLQDFASGNITGSKGFI